MGEMADEVIKISSRNLLKGGQVKQKNIYKFTFVFHSGHLRHHVHDIISNAKYFRRR